MPNQTTALARPIDPEFAEVYEQAKNENSSRNVPRQSQPSANPRNSQGREVPSLPRLQNQNQEVDDAFEGADALKRIALENQANSRNRRDFAPGSFDQVEHDVSNAIKVGWDWLTR